MLIVTDSREINETIDGDVLLKDMADVRIYGVVNGDVHAFPGTTLSVIGQVNGSVVATDATVYVKAGAVVQYGFSTFAEESPKRSPFSHTQTSDKHLTSAMKKHCKLLDEIIQNHV